MGNFSVTTAFAKCSESGIRKQLQFGSTQQRKIILTIFPVMLSRDQKSLVQELHEVKQPVKGELQKVQNNLCKKKLYIYRKQKGNDC